MGRKFELARRPDFTRLQAELHRVRVELFPVVELDALAKLDLPHRGGHQLRHLAGERGHDLEVLIALHERVEDVGGHHRRGRLLLIHGVERAGIDSLGDHDLALGGRPRVRRRHEQGGQERE
jgi:hypothetical protein